MIEAMKKVLMLFAAAVLAAGSALAQKYDVTADGKITTRHRNGKWNLAVNGILIARNLTARPVANPGAQVFLIEKNGEFRYIDIMGRRLSVEEMKRYYDVDVEAFVEMERLTARMNEVAFKSEKAEGGYRLSIRGKYFATVASARMLTTEPDDRYWFFAVQPDANGKWAVMAVDTTTALHTDLTAAVYDMVFGNEQGAIACLRSGGENELYNFDGKSEIVFEKTN